VALGCPSYRATCLGPFGLLTIEYAGRTAFLRARLLCKGLVGLGQTADPPDLSNGGYPYIAQVR
jgi:hypothetical protein